jgi:hypothetical protein
VTLELRDRDQAERWLLGGLALMRLSTPTADELLRVTPWLLALVDDVPSLPPAGMIADVGRLLLGRGLTLAPSLVPPGAERLRAALRAYEDEWLGRLAADSRVDAAADAVARLPENLRAQAIALVAGSILDRVGFSAGAAVSPGVARRLLNRTAPENLTRGLEAVRQTGETLDQLALGYEGLVQRARQARQLLDEPDVFALENLTVLGSLAQRVAIAQVIEAAGELGRALPKRLKPRRRTLGPTPTKLEDESAYPVGGFASMSTSGSLENLVTSELIYMDEQAADVDLFDMRYVEGELLYYTRDEAIFVRQRRAIDFVLDTSLVEARFKDPELRWQRLVTALGLVACATRKLYEWLNEEALTIRVLFLRDSMGNLPLAAERGLCQLVLREWIDKGMAEVGDTTLAELATAAAVEARRARVQVVLVGPPALETAWQLLGPDARIEQVRFDAGEARSWPAWLEAALELLLALL